MKILRSGRMVKQEEAGKVKEEAVGLSQESGEWPPERGCPCVLCRRHRASHPSPGPGWRLSLTEASPRPGAAGHGPRVREPP